MSLFDAYSRYQICPTDGHLSYHYWNDQSDFYTCENDCCYCDQCNLILEKDK